MADTTIQEKASLTPREQEIFDLLLEGVYPKDIAYKLDVSYKTVDRYRTQIYRKLGVKSIHELITKFGSPNNDNIKYYEPHPVKKRLIDLFDNP